jgi:spermidine synthase
MTLFHPYLWLFLSGAIALTFEVLWTRYFQILLGNTIYSFSWVTGAFLLGISLGSYLGGYLVRKIYENHEDKGKALLQLYFLSEVFVLITSVISFLILLNPPMILINFLSPKSFIKDGLAALCFILPTTLSMGVGLPVLTQRFGKTFDIENLYASNTIGGGLGLIGLSFFGLILLGYKGLILITFLLNVFLIIIVLYSTKTSSKIQGLVKLKNRSHEEVIKKGKFIFLSFISGFLLLGLEAVWFRTSELILNDRTYITTLVLFVVLTLLGIASYLTPKLEKKLTGFLSYFLFFGLLSLAGAELISEEAFLIARDFPRVTPSKISYLLLVFIIPLCFFSFAFPKILIAREWDGRDVAHFVFSNTLGGLLGTLLVSYGLIGSFGMKSFFWVAFLLIPFFWFMEEEKFRKSNKLFPLLFVVPFLLFSFFYQGTIHIHKSSHVIKTKELPQGLFSLVKSNKDKLEMYNGNYRIVAPYKSFNGEHAQKALAYFPALYHMNPKEILTMGTGYGISIASFLKLNPQKVDAIEVHPMVNQVSHYFKDLNNEWYSNPNVNKYISDARGFLSRTPEKYDLISSNIASPYTTSGSLFLTKEYFLTVKDHLKQDGIYSQLVWGPHLPEIIHTFKKVFPHIKALPGYDESDFILIGSFSPLELKRPLTAFNGDWPAYKKLDRKSTVELGEKLLSKALEKKPEFIISDHSAVLTHNFSRGLNFFWIHQ